MLMKNSMLQSTSSGLTGCVSGITDFFFTSFDRAFLMSRKGQRLLHLTRIKIYYFRFPSFYHMHLHLDPHCNIPTLSCIQYILIVGTL